MEENRALFAAHIRDLARGAARGKPKFSAFLSAEQQAKAKDVLRREEGFDSLLFDGGFDEAERRILGIFPPGESPRADVFPITPFMARIPKGFTLTHRDFLGAMTALGIKREVVGDILITGENEGKPVRAFFFVCTPAAELIRRELCLIGRVGVTVEDVSRRLIEEAGAVPRFAEERYSVASPRLDCVVSALAQISRREAERLIESGLVALGGVPCEKAAKNAADGERLSIRGRGKYQLGFSGETTRKGRLILHVKRYL